MKINVQPLKYHEMWWFLFKSGYGLKCFPCFLHCYFSFPLHQYRFINDITGLVLFLRIFYTNVKILKRDEHNICFIFNSAHCLLVSIPVPLSV